MRTEFFWEQDGLNGLAISAVTPKPEKIIVLLHGYQGDADSNMVFARTLADAFPETMIVVPNGTARMPPGDDPHRRQWWNIDLENFSGSLCAAMPDNAPEEKQEGIRRIGREANETAAILNRFIRNMLKEEGLALKDCYLVGISQGGMTAFEMILFREELHRDDDGSYLAGMVTIGSGIPDAGRIRDRASYFYPPVPVLLTRGTADEIFPPEVDLFSKNLLQANGFPVETAQEDSVHYGLEHRVAGHVCSFIRGNMEKFS